METILHVKSEFKSVYLLNGAFVENADSFKYANNEPIYITTLPLNAHHLPYTVKVLGGKALSNENLVNVYTLPSDHIYIKLMPRYNYVYSTKHQEPIKNSDNATQFFLSVKQGNLPIARNCMTESLSASIDDNELLAFFDDYKDIVDSKAVVNSLGGYFLIDNNDRGSLFKFVFSDNLIDDIIENKK